MYELTPTKLKIMLLSPILFVFTLIKWWSISTHPTIFTLHDVQNWIKSDFYIHTYKITISVYMDDNDGHKISMIKREIILQLKTYIPEIWRVGFWNY